jgi:hypothetical protein
MQDNAQQVLLNLIAHRGRIGCVRREVVTRTAAVFHAAVIVSFD